MTSYIIREPIYLVQTEHNTLNLDFISHIGGSTYSLILDSLNKYQLKSLHDFIFMHITICKKNKLLTENDSLEPFSNVNDMNNQMKSFINGDIVREIFVANLLRVYFR
jgi:hypothetical protein